MKENKWLRIGLTLLVGLFVAYLDRSNLSVGLPAMAKDLGFSGPNFAVTSSWALTAFLIGYAFSNFFGGILTYKLSPKMIVVVLFAVWSLATFLTGWVSSVALLVFYRLILGVGEGIYWPQQSRFAEAWFRPDELTRANSVIQYYGQYLSLGLGFLILTPLYNAFSWRPLFIITGGIGLVVIVPLYAIMLRDKPKGSVSETKASSIELPKQKLSLKSLGGARFLLLVFSYLANGMLFWGITLWIPMAVKSLGFTGLSQGFASALPYLLAVVLTIPMALISDRTGKRVLVASLGLIISGILLVILPGIQSAAFKLIFISIAVGYYASSFTPNIWAIIQSTVDRQSIGAAAGIVNGIGSGAGGVIAGWIVGLLYSSTKSYVPGFVVLGIIAVLGGLSLLYYGRLTHTSFARVEKAGTMSH